MQKLVKLNKMNSYNQQNLFYHLLPSIIDAQLHIVTLKVQPVATEFISLQIEQCVYKKSRMHINAHHAPWDDNVAFEVSLVSYFQLRSELVHKHFKRNSSIFLEMFNDKIHTKNRNFLISLLVPRKLTVIVSSQEIVWHITPCFFIYMD